MILDTAWLLPCVVGLWLGSIELRIKMAENKLTRRPDRYEVIKEIDIRLEPIKVQQENIKEDISYIRNQLDKLLERLGNK